MLILIRRVGETVMVGDDVKITIMAVKGVKTRIGIDAPRNLAVHREEVYRLLQQQPELAGQAGSVAELVSAERTSSVVTGPDS